MKSQTVWISDLLNRLDLYWYCNRIASWMFTLTTVLSQTYASTQLNMLSMHFFFDDSTISSYQKVISGVTVWPNYQCIVFKYLITVEKEPASHQSKSNCKYCEIVHWMKQMWCDSLFLIVFSDKVTKNGFRCYFAHGPVSLVPLTKIIATERASICKDIMVISFFPFPIIQALFFHSLLPDRFRCATMRLQFFPRIE